MPRRAAFTLLELLLVMVMIVMVLAIAYPALDKYIAEARLQAGADHLRTRFAEARSHAIETGQPYLFAVKPGESGYRLAPDDSDSNNGIGNGTQPSSNGQTDAIVVEDTMPSNIKFNLDAAAASGQTMSNGYTGILTFMPDGSCSDDKTIRLDLQGASPIEIRVRGLTGSVTVRGVN
jgi:prepilin-type N-terminal cleavage/methylation domain-containing protein